MRLLLTLGIVWLCFSATAQEETPLQFPTLQDGDTLSEAFEQEMTSALYTFYALEGDEVTLSMQPEDEKSHLDPLLVLFDTEGHVLGFDDDGGEVTYAARLNNILIPADGYYIVMATTFNFLQIDRPLPKPEKYLLEVSGMSAVEEVEPLKLLAETATFDTQYELDMTLDTPLIFFWLEAEEGQHITVELESRDFDTLLYIFDPHGKRIAINDDRGFSSDDSNSQINGLEIRHDGTYLIVATSYNFQRAQEDDFANEGRARLTIHEVEG